MSGAFSKVNLGTSGANQFACFLTGDFFFFLCKNLKADFKAAHLAFSQGRGSLWLNLVPSAKIIP